MEYQTSSAILPGISNYIHYKMWDDITYPFQISTVKPLKFGNVCNFLVMYAILSHTLLHVSAMLGLKLNRINKSAPSELQTRSKQELGLGGYSREWFIPLCSMPADGNKWWH